MGLSHSLCSANNSIHLVNIQSSTCNDQQGRTKVHGDDGQLVLRLLDQLLQLAAVDLALNDVLLHQCVSTVPPECYALRLAPYVLVGLHDVETEVGDLLHRVAVVLGLRRQHLQQQSTQLALQLVTLLSISLVGVP